MEMCPEAFLELSQARRVTGVAHVVVETSCVAGVFDRDLL
jgi:hypothetical protein